MDLNLKLATGADGDGLKHTQDAGGADGESPQDLVQEDKHFAFEIIWNVPCFPKVCRYQKSCGEEHEDVCQSQVGDGEVGEPGLVAHKASGNVEAKQTSVC